MIPFRCELQWDNGSRRYIYNQPTFSTTLSHHSHQQALNFGTSALPYWVLEITRRTSDIFNSWTWAPPRHTEINCSSGGIRTVGSWCLTKVKDPWTSLFACCVKKGQGREGAGKDKTECVARGSVWQEGVGGQLCCQPDTTGALGDCPPNNRYTQNGRGWARSQADPTPWRYHWPHSEYIGLKSSHWKNFIVQLNPLAVNYSKFTKHKLFVLLTLSSCPYA